MLTEKSKIQSVFFRAILLALPLFVFAGCIQAPRAQTVLDAFNQENPDAVVLTIDPKRGRDKNHVFMHIRYTTKDTPIGKAELGVWEYERQGKQWVRIEKLQGEKTNE